MHEVKANQRIKLDNYIDSTLYKAYGNRIYLNLFIPLGKYSFRNRFNSFNNRICSLAKDIDRLYRNLSGIPNLEVYKKAQIPQRYHYQSNVRIGGMKIQSFTKLIISKHFLYSFRYFSCY